MLMWINTARPTQSPGAAEGEVWAWGSFCIMPGAGTGLVVFTGSWESLQYGMAEYKTKLAQPLLLTMIQVCTELIKQLVITDITA